MTDGIRTREVTTGVERNGVPEKLLISDDGYRIRVRWLAGAPDHVDPEYEVVWAEYKQCDHPHLGKAVADFLFN